MTQKKARGKLKIFIVEVNKQINTYQLSHDATGNITTFQDMSEHRTIYIYIHIYIASQCLSLLHRLSQCLSLLHRLINIASCSRNVTVFQATKQVVRYSSKYISLFKVKNAYESEHTGNLISLALIAYQ